MNYTKLFFRGFMAVLIVLLLLLLVFLLLVLNSPTFQSRLTNTVMDQIEAKAGADIHVDHVDFDLGKGLVLKETLILDANGDTLLFAESAHGDLAQNIASLISNELHLNEIMLDGVKLNLIKKKGELTSNLDKFIQAFKGDSEKPKSESGFSLNLDEITIRNATVRIVDENTDGYKLIKAQKLFINIDKIDLSKKIFHLDEILVEAPMYDEIIGDSKKKLSNPKETADSTQVENPESELEIIIHKLSVLDGIVNRRFENSRIPSHFDVNNFGLQHVNLETTSFELKNKNQLSGQINHLNAEINGVKTLDNFACQSFNLSDKLIELTGFGVHSNNTSLNQSIRLDFNSFQDFKNKLENIRIDTKITNTQISLEDIYYYVPALKQVTQLKEISPYEIDLDANLKGNINHLTIPHMVIRVGDIFNINAKGIFKKKTSDNLDFIDLKVNELHSSIVDINRILLKDSLPAQFLKLGSLDFNGTISGYTDDLTFEGDLATALGGITSQLTIDFTEGVQGVKYNGFLRLDRFDLREWTENEDFDKVSLEAQINYGEGIEFSRLNTSAALDISDFSYKQYAYDHLKFDGQIKEKTFSGHVFMNDKNANFEGNIDISDLDSRPHYIGNLNIDFLDLNALNLSKTSLALAGEFQVDLAAEDIRTASGFVLAQDLRMILKDQNYKVDSLTMTTEQIAGRHMYVTIDSDVLSASIDGVFNLARVHNSFINILKKNYPYHTKHLRMQDANNTNDEQYAFTMDMHIKDTKNLLEIAGLKGFQLTNTDVKILLDDSRELFEVDLETPRFQLPESGFSKIKLHANNRGNKGFLSVQLDSSLVRNELYNPIFLETKTNGDSLDFNLRTTQEIADNQMIQFSGRLIPDDNGYQLSILNNELYMLGSYWKIDPRNQIAFGDKYLGINYLRVTDGNRAIVIDDINHEGVNVDLIDFDVELLNPIINYDKLLFSGKSIVNVKVNNVFDKTPFILVGADIPEFRINEELYGELKIDVDKRFTTDIAQANIELTKGDQHIKVEGGYNIKTSNVGVNVDIQQFPMHFFEYIIKDGISETKGTVDIDAYIQGPLTSIDSVRLKGEALVSKAGTKIDYLGEYYTVDRQRVVLNERQINASGLRLRDSRNNVATLQGGLKHIFFSDFELDLNIRSDRFVGLNTTRFENPLYYGLAEGKMSVDFSGDFDAPTFKVEATTGPGTKLSIPIGGSDYALDKSFITFVKRDTIGQSEDEKSDDDNKGTKLTGVDFEMNLVVTEDAEVELLFNEATGEVLKGNGTGNLSLFIKRTGEFDVFGTYNVSDGEYLFNAYSLIAKRFRINPGGTIVWTGDPFNANLDVSASYSRRLPLDVFLVDYLGNASERVQDEARNRTDVRLDLILDGTLFNPVVSFGIEIPDVAGDLRSYVNSKMRALENTENGINNQVLGILVFNAFLPENDPLSNVSASEYSQAATNTVAEYLTSQLSLLLTESVQGAIGDSSFIESVDLVLGLNENVSLLNDQPDQNDFVPDEASLETEFQFRDVDFLLNMDLGYVWEPLYASISSYLLGQVGLEYFLTKDRRLRFRVYSKFDIDETENQRKNRYGFGLNYSFDFGKLGTIYQIKNDTINRIEANKKQ